MTREELIGLIRSKARIEGHTAWEGGYYHLANADEIADAILVLGQRCADCVKCGCLPQFDNRT